MSARASVGLAVALILTGCGSSEPTCDAGSCSVVDAGSSADAGPPPPCVVTFAGNYSETDTPPGGCGGLHLGLPVLLQRSREERALQRCQGASAPHQPMHVLVAVPADERDLEPLVPDALPVAATQPEDTVRTFFAIASTSLALGS